MVGGKGQAQLDLMKQSNRLGSVALHKLLQAGRGSKCAVPFQAGFAGVGDPSSGTAPFTLQGFDNGRAWML